MKLYGGNNKKKQPSAGRDDFEIDWERARQKHGDIVPKRYSPEPPAARSRISATPPTASPAKKKINPTKPLVFALLFIVGLYNIAIFSNIPFIVKWRTIYIETAMDTMTHQWLAKAFIPPFVIEKAMLGRYEMEVEQDGVSSNWGTGSVSGIEHQPWDKVKKRFGKEYPEIDQDSFEAYLSTGDYLDKDGYLLIDKADLGSNGTDITTVYGDKVMALDTRNGIIITEVSGEGYVGRMAIVKNPDMVSMGLAPKFGSVGAVISEIADANNAVLAINANGFLDPDGHGNGGHPYGLVRSGGKTHNATAGGKYKVIAFDKDNRLNIGNYSDVTKFRDGAEFRPALIVNGKTLVEGSAGWGIQPRTVIGQTKSGLVLMLVIDGRAPGYSIGATLGQCADIMERYGAEQSCNLDGGSSSLMVYRGREITRPSAANKEIGRRVPCAFIVKNI